MPELQTDTYQDLDPQVLSKPVVVGLEDVTKVYGMDDLEVRALNGVSFTVRQGAYCSIMGASGSGKSTAMNMIGCLGRPTRNILLVLR